MSSTPRLFRRIYRHLDTPGVKLRAGNPRVAAWIDSRVRVSRGRAWGCAVRAEVGGGGGGAGGAMRAVWGSWARVRYRLEVALPLVARRLARISRIFSSTFFE